MVLRWSKLCAAISEHSFNIGSYGENVLKKKFSETSKQIKRKHDMNGP
jgi:hypothetical protein